MSIVISGVNNNDKITASDGTIDLLSGVTYGSEITVPSLKLGNNIQLGNAGIITARSFAGNISGTTGTFGDFVDVGNNIQLGNAGVVTATTFVGNVTGNVNNTSNLLFQIGGSEKVRINSNGQLGIGVNPTHTLEILSGADHQNVIMVRGNDATTEYAGMGVYNGYAVFTGGGVGSTSAGIIFRTAATGNESERLRITSDGAVMINKTSSFGTVPLQVKGASSGLSDGGQIFDIGTADGSSGTRLAFGVSEDNFGWIRSYESGVGGRDIVFAASEERMRITSTGLVGIATNSPSAALLDIATDQGSNDQLRLRRLSSDSNVAANWSFKPYAGNLYFRSGGSTDKIYFDDSGDINIMDGNLIIATAGHGIDFSATANGGSGTPSELLDDYEEGYFAPEVTNLTSGYGSGTFYNRQARYTKVGNMVTCWVHMQWWGNAVTSGNNNTELSITGFPFEVDGVGYSGSCGGGLQCQSWRYSGSGWNNYATTSDNVQPRIDSLERIRFGVIGHNAITGQVTQKSINGYAPNIEFFFSVRVTSYK